MQPRNPFRHTSFSKLRNLIGMPRLCKSGDLHKIKKNRVHMSSSSNIPRYVMKSQLKPYANLWLWSHFTDYQSWQGLTTKYEESFFLHMQIPHFYKFHRHQETVSSRLASTLRLDSIHSHGICSNSRDGANKSGKSNWSWLKSVITQSKHWRESMLLLSKYKTFTLFSLNLSDDYIHITTYSAA